MKLKRIGIKNNITARWLKSVFSVIAILIVVMAVVVALLIRSYLETGIRSAVPEYVASFEQLFSVSQSDFREKAISLTESFDHNDKVKVIVIDKNGRVIASTDGFLTGEATDEMPDYITARDTGAGSFEWSGKNTDGERIMATTVMVKNIQSSETTGAYRYIISLRPFDRALGVYYIIIAAVGLIMALLVAVTGIFFVSSIVNPVRQVTGAARKIAMGDLSMRLESRREDEIGELCDTINYMASELGKADTMKNDFISSVSHELRTPLTAIKGWGETVRLSIGSDDELVGRGVDVMLSETDRLSKLVEELLDFSRMQSGKLSVDMSVIDIVTVLDEAVGMYEELAKKQGLTLTYLRPKTQTDVMADKNRLKQVFINIIDNAVKYTESGGQILISTALEDGCIKTVVSDTGVGIPQEDIAHVKEKFYKANKTVRGSGIGLAVADEIIKQHNGLIIVESRETVGTTVTVVLPICVRTDGNGDNDEQK